MYVQCNNHEKKVPSPDIVHVLFCWIPVPWGGVGRVERTGFNFVHYILDFLFIFFLSLVFFSSSFNMAFVVIFTGICVQYSKTRYHEFHGSCHSVTFIVLVNSHQR